MIVVLTSPSAIAPGDKVSPDAVQALSALADAGWPVGVVSNHSKPAWFDSTFPANKVAFIQRIGRQDGQIVAEVATQAKMAAHDVIVLGATDTDLQMAKNGGAVLVVAGWAADSKTQSYGLIADDPAELTQVMHLVSKWPGGWYFQGKMSWYRVLSLSNVSGFNVSNEQKAFAAEVVKTIKNGGPQIKALLAVVARSMLMSGIVDQKEMMFGFYPSSSSANDDTEVLSEFVHRLRTVTSRVKLAKRDVPLFIRHTPSTKRSAAGGGVDRTDPSEQVETLHLNPKYRTNIEGRHVVIVDDCTTYGVSFGVAAGFLKAAGAAAVTGLALGKFGKQLRYYEIDIQSDPFKPVTKGHYTFKSEFFSGTGNETAQLDLRKLL